VLLAEGTEFTGLLALDGPARIDGQLRGEVIGPGPLFIGPRARVEARVETDELVVAGVLAGEVRVSRRSPRRDSGSAGSSTPSPLAEERWPKASARPVAAAPDGGAPDPSAPSS
jgi:hypothetical protein